jgi:phage terminase small subunit
MGILRQPNSVRASREGGVHFDEPQAVVAPAWLPVEIVPQFNTLVRDLAEASVPLKQADNNAIALCAQCLTELAYWTKQKKNAKTIEARIECSKLIVRYGRDSQKWLETLCATPAARARIGLKATGKKKGAFANLLEMKKNVS